MKNHDRLDQYQFWVTIIIIGQHETGFMVTSNLRQVLHCLWPTKTNRYTKFLLILCRENKLKQKSHFILIGWVKVVSWSAWAKSVFCQDQNFCVTVPNQIHTLEVYNLAFKNYSDPINKHRQTGTPDKHTLFDWLIFSSNLIMLALYPVFLFNN